MNSFAVATLAEWAGGRVLAGDPAAVVSSFAWDSRQVRPGQCFVALPGARADGHDFVAAAFAQGAACALVSRPVPVPPGRTAVLVDDTLLALGTLAARHRAQFAIPVVGVTGSVGKTTTKEMVWTVLQAHMPTLKTEGNLNSEVGLPAMLLNELHDGHRAAVLEMGMRALGEIAYLVSIARPNLGIVTNVGISHLELLGSQDNIARAKGELVAGLPPDGFAILNADDPRVRAMAQRAPCPVVWYSLEGAWGERFVTLQHRRPEGEGQAFTLVTWQGEAEVHLPAPGPHLAQAALAAAAAGLCLGLTPGQVAAALAGYRPPAGRLQVRQVAGVRILDDTYNAAPASVKAALAVLADLAQGGRRVAALGDMHELGPMAEAGHREVGAAAAHLADALVAVGDMARWMAESAREAGLQAVYHFATKAEAADFLARYLQPGDTLLVKGSRGMKMEELIQELEKRL